MEWTASAQLNLHVRVWLRGLQHQVADDLRPDWRRGGPLAEPDMGAHVLGQVVAAHEALS